MTRNGTVGQRLDEFVADAAISWPQGWPELLVVEDWRRGIAWGGFQASEVSLCSTW